LYLKLPREAEDQPQLLLEGDNLNHALLLKLQLEEVVEVSHPELHQ
jgi:hypothetical protein